MSTRGEGSEPNREQTEFPDYTVSDVEVVSEDMVDAGDVVYFQTVNGSGYIFEVEGYAAPSLKGTMSRRGKEAKVSETMIGNLDNVPTSIYADYDSLTTRHDGAYICSTGLPQFVTSKVAHMLLIKPISDQES